MPEHYSKNTFEVTAWCKKYNSMTQHRVDPPKLGPCLVCVRKLELSNEAARLKRNIDAEAKAEHDARNPRLPFPEEPVQPRATRFPALACLCLLSSRIVARTVARE
jgi:hypothetical protein